MDLKNDDIIIILCVSPLWTYALHRQDERVGGPIIIIWPCINSHHMHQRALGMCECGTVLRVWLSEFLLESHVGS